MFLSFLILTWACFLTAGMFHFNGKAQRVLGMVDHRFISSGHQRTIPMIKYHYAIQGITYAEETEVTGDTWGRLLEGGTVPVKYLPEQPSQSRIDLSSEDQRARHNIETLVLIGLPAFLFSFYVFSMKGTSANA